jgi:hypothetical protein
MVLSSYHSSVVKVPLAPRISPAPERGGYYHPALLLSSETQKPMQTFSFASAQLQALSRSVVWFIGGWCR